jgi:hypothetical protein
MRYNATWTKPQSGMQRAALSGAAISIEPPVSCHLSVCEERAMLFAAQTHLAKELFHDTSSTTHDRRHAGEEFLTAYPKLLRATGLAVCAPFQ